MICPLCNLDRKNIIFETPKLAIIVVMDDLKAPAFCRVIWKMHVKEMSDLPVQEQQLLIGWVVKLEQAMRKVLNPTKMNLASFGNMVPHLHWHVIARFEEDMCFPDSIWAEAKRVSFEPNFPENWVAQVQEQLQNSI